MKFSAFLLTMFLCALTSISIADDNSINYQEFYPDFNPYEVWHGGWHTVDVIYGENGQRFERPIDAQERLTAVHNFMQYTNRCNTLHMHNERRKRVCVDAFYAGINGVQGSGLCAALVSGNTRSYDRCMNIISSDRRFTTIFRNIKNRLEDFGWVRTSETVSCGYGANWSPNCSLRLQPGRFSNNREVINHLNRYRNNETHIQLINEACGDFTTHTENKLYQCILSDTRELRTIAENGWPQVESVFPKRPNDTDYSTIQFSDDETESLYYGYASMSAGAANNILRNFLSNTLGCTDVDGGVYVNEDNGWFSMSNYNIRAVFRAECPEQINSIDVDLDIRNKNHIVLTVNIDDQERGQLQEVFYAFHNSDEYLELAIEHDYSYVSGVATRTINGK